MSADTVQAKLVVESHAGDCVVGGYAAAGVIGEELLSRIVRAEDNECVKRNRGPAGNARIPWAAALRLPDREATRTVDMVPLAVFIVIDELQLDDKSALILQAEPTNALKRDV